MIFGGIIIRLRSFLLSIKNLNLQKIVLVSHGTFLSQITEYMLDNCEVYDCEYNEVYEKFF